MAASAHADAPASNELPPPPPITEPRAVFGNGNGYGAQVAIADAAAMASVPIILSIGWATNSWHQLDAPAFIAANAPFVLTGPIVHFIHARPAFGVVSLFGWASVAVTAQGVGFVSMFPGCGEAAPCGQGRGGAIAIAIAAGGGALMTMLDAWMARSVHVAEPRRAAAVTPTAWALPSGGGVGLAGAF